MFNINIHDQALAHMMASALESYLVPGAGLKGGNSAPVTPVETTGPLLGQTNVSRSGDLVRFDLTHAGTYTVADRQRNSVTWNTQSNHLHREVYSQLMPPIEYLGDFHSHPYSRFGDELIDLPGFSYRDIVNGKCYQYSGHPEGSDGDFANHYPKSLPFAQYSLGLVLTLYQMKAPGNAKFATHLDHYSAVEFSYSGKFGTPKYLYFRCWLKVYVCPAHSTHPIADDKVHLYCPALGVSQALNIQF